MQVSDPGALATELPLRASGGLWNVGERGPFFSGQSFETKSYQNIHIILPPSGWASFCKSRTGVDSEEQHAGLGLGL